MSRPASTKPSRATKRRRAERGVLATLRELGNLRAYEALFALVVDLARDPAAPQNVRYAWSLLEDVLSTDLDP